MNKAFRGEWTTLPNLLTLSRVLLVPVFAGMLVSGRPKEAFLIFLLAGITDVLDGMAARLKNQKSRLGLWLDPAADKLLLTTAYVLMSFPRFVGPNVVPLRLSAVVVGRDVLIALAALVLYKWKGQKAFYPTLLGKVSTVIQVLTICVVVVCNALGEEFFLLPWIYDATLAATVLSGVQYALLSRRMISAGKKPE
jgi:cardiolipin synthase (CMP-forming)